MQQLGFVVRRRLEHDQRRVRVSLTPRARSLAARMTPEIETTYRRIEGLLGGDFSTRFQRMLDELLATLQPPSVRRARPARRMSESALVQRGSS
jgi:DNA-binding MarR family transcriptional regulator